MKKEKEYESIAEFFYKKASARVKTKVEESCIFRINRSALTLN